MLKACDVQRWDQSSCVLDFQGVFRIDAVFCEELIDRGAQELAVDEDVERDAVRVTMQQVVYECRKLVSAQSWKSVSERNSHLITNALRVRSHPSGVFALCK